MREPAVEVPVSDLDQQEVYVGPRPFERSEQNLFFGRDREISELLSLVTSNRVVLCYAPSGAGKTSLINAGLQPRLEKEGFEVLPSTRVRGLIPEGVDQKDITNIYIFNAVLSLSKETGKLSQLAHSTLAGFLSSVPHLTDEEGFPSPRILIFDQFEELLTSYVERWSERDGFFHQVRDALQEDPLLRVLFVMREDYVARIEPFMRILKPLQQTRFRLDLLGPSGAQAAVTGPLRGTQRRFKDGVVNTLIEELLKVRVESTQGEATEVVGEYVEPVQLQVVCRNLWNSLPADVQEISQEHLKAYGDVDQALRDFYESCLAGAKASLRTDEADLRQWFERQLITPAGTRSIVFRDAQHTAGLANAVVDFLENRHVIRGEWRAGSRWYELTHDRLIEPIQRSNERWRARRQSRRNRILGFAAGTVALGLVLSSLFLSFRQTNSASPPLAYTQSASTVVAVQTVAQEQVAVAQENVAISQSRQLAAQALLAQDPELARVLAIQANRFYDTPEARRTLHRILSGQGLVDGQFLQTYDPKIISPRLIERLDNEENKWVVGLAFSPDGQRFVSAGQDTLLLWDVDPAKQAETLSIANMSNTQSVAFSPDRSWVFTGNTNGQILIWDAFAGQLLDPPLSGHVGLVRSIAFSANGKRLASGDSNGTIIIWDFSPGQRPERVRELKTGHQDVWSVAWSPDGKYLASAGADSTVKLWDTESFSEVRTLSGHRGLVWSVAWSPNGRTLASTSGSRDLTDGEVILWDVESGTQIARPREFATVQTARRVLFDPSGTILVVARDDGNIVFWDVATQTVSGTFKAHNNRVMSLAFSPDGRFLISGGVDGTIALWNLLAATNSIAVSPNGSVLAASQGSIISLWHLTVDETEPVRILAGHTGDILSLVFSPDSSTLASSGKDNTIQFWEVGPGRPKGSPILTQSNPTTLQYSPDGSMLAIGEESGRVQIYDPVTGDLRILTDQKIPVLRVQFVADGGSLEVVRSDGSLTTIDVVSQSPQQQSPQGVPLPDTQGGITSVALSADGMKAAYFRPGVTGGTATLASDGRAHGIDISYWDQSFDPTVNPDDIDFVIVKATEGADYVDPLFDDYVNSIRSIPMRGAYHYFQENQPWKEQADLFLSTVKDQGFHFYILDLEVKPADGSSEFLADAEQWLKYVDEQVEGPVLLGTIVSYLTAFEQAGSSIKDWPLFVFQYQATRDRNGNPSLPQGFRDWKLWNYTDRGNGPAFGVSADRIYLVVYNGTPAEMGQWLGISTFSILDRTTNQAITPPQPIQVTSPNGIAFSPNGSYIAIANDDAVSLLNAQTGDEVSALPVGGRAVFSLAFTPESSRLAIGTEDGTVILWDLRLLQEGLSSDPMLELACLQVRQNLSNEQWAQFVGADTPYQRTCTNLPTAG